MKKLTKEQFIERAVKVHGDVYDYSRVNYINNRREIEIVCKIHGLFLQTPSNHIDLIQGCPDCGEIQRRESNTFTKQEWIDAAKLIHGDLYDYSKTIYDGCENKVEIICKKHGSFHISPNNHIHNSKSGCPTCSQSKRELKMKIRSDNSISEKMWKDGEENWCRKCPKCKLVIKYICKQTCKEAVDHGRVCNFCKHDVDLEGKRFGKLVVIRRMADRKTGETQWECQCDCGKKTIKPQSRLKRKLTRSCGCFSNEFRRTKQRLRPYESLYNSMLYSTIKYMGRTCDITYEDFVTFTKTKECHYCGKSVGWMEYYQHGKKSCSGYNLDRIDNEKGYSNENCVVCCWTCNSVKAKRFTYEQMKEIGPFVRKVLEKTK